MWGLGIRMILGWAPQKPGWWDRTKHWFSWTLILFDIKESRKQDMSVSLSIIFYYINGPCSRYPLVDTHWNSRKWPCTSYRIQAVYVPILGKHLRVDVWNFDKAISWNYKRQNPNRTRVYQGVSATGFIYVKTCWGCPKKLGSLSKIHLWNIEWCEFVFKINPPNKDASQGRGSYLCCIVILLCSMIAGCQPTCLDLPRLA
jgi:hypothetical protein